MDSFITNDVIVRWYISVRVTVYVYMSQVFIIGYYYLADDPNWAYIFWVKDIWNHVCARVFNGKWQWRVRRVLHQINSLNFEMQHTLWNGIASLISS